MSWLFAGPAQLITLWPYAGVAIAIALIGLQALIFSRQKLPFNRDFFRQPPVFAGLLWLIYGFYERQMMAIAQMAGSQSPVALRLDSLVLTPIMLIFSALALWSLFSQLKKR